MGKIVSKFNTFSVILLFFSATLHASALSDAFNTLVSTTHLGNYRSQVRGYMTAGGADIHFPDKNVFPRIAPRPPSASLRVEPFKAALAVLGKSGQIWEIV